MRLQSQTTVRVRGKHIGGPMPLICVPLVAGDQAALIAQAEAVTALFPDMVEWRVDAFEGVEDIPMVLHALAVLRGIVGDMPLIFTCRAVTEGGFREISQASRMKVNLVAVASGQVDLLDTELSNDPPMICELKDACRKKGVKLILSFHDFEKTPSAAFILDRLVSAQDFGADIAKVAVMPRSHRDVLTLLEATVAARSQTLRIPMITLSMGDLGALTRIVGGFFGSDITFATGGANSAPGQIPMEDLRTAWGAIPGFR